MFAPRKTSLLAVSLPCLLAITACGDDTSNANDEVGNSASETGPTTGNTEASDTVSSGDGDGDGDPTTTGDGDGDPTTTGDGDGDPTTTGDGDGDPTTTGDGDGDPTTTGDGDGDPTTGDGDGDPCQGGNMGFDFSYLWVANTDSGTVSKVNTETLVEEARYRTGIENVYHSPSRTTVSLDGRFALVGNRNSMSITLVAANTADCIDKNNDNVITTSLGANDVLAWGTDECVLWHTVLPDVGPGEVSGPRAMTFDPGTFNEQTCEYEGSKIWVGWHGVSATQSHMAHIDPVTGAVVETVDINNWVMGDNSWPPYGAALDGIGNVWFSALRGEVFRLNTNSLQLDRWAMPNNVQAYGMTVDPEGNAWFGGCSGPVTMFDAQAETFTSVPNTNACHRGVAADSLGNIWVASNGPCGLVQIDRETKTLIKFHNAADFNNQCSTPVGVSIDVEGYVWMVDQAGWAWKMDPETYAKEVVAIAGNHYTYSDMTGGGLNAVINPQ